MNILDQIIKDKRLEVAEQKKQTTSSRFEKCELFSRETLSLKEFVSNPELSGIIAEFKRQSPSKGIINDKATVVEVTKAYVKAGVSGLSVLTNEVYFGGKNKDVTAARVNNNAPVLRKEFIIDEFQILEAKAIGADAILLIASALSDKEILNFAKLAKSINLDVLLEIHNEKELSSINQFVDLVGVNNRNLQTFATNIQVSKDLANKIPNNFVKVSESGIHEPIKIIELKEYGYQGFLIGERFMATSNPGKACQNFIKSLYL